MESFAANEIRVLTEEVEKNPGLAAKIQFDGVGSHLAPWDAGTPYVGAPGFEDHSFFGGGGGGKGGGGGLSGGFPVGGHGMFFLK